MAKTINELFATYIPKKMKAIPFEEYVEEKTPRKWNNTVLLMEHLPGKKTNKTAEEKPAEKSEEKENVSVIEQPVQKPLEIDIENPRLAAQKRLQQYRNNAYYKDFITHLDNYFKDNAIYDDIMRDHLIAIAGFESSYDPKATVNGSSASGWFGFTNGTRTDVGNNMTREEFMNDKNAQIQAAVNLYGKRKQLLRSWIRDYNVNMNSLGKTPLQLMYGMWWNPGSMQNYLQNGDDSFVDALNMNLNKIFNKAA